MEITETWVVVSLVIIGVVLCSLLWIGKRNFGTKPGRPGGPGVTDVALGAGIVASMHHGHGAPVDGGSAGSASVGGDGGGGSL